MELKSDTAPETQVLIELAKIQTTLGHIDKQMESLNIRIEKKEIESNAKIGEIHSQIGGLHAQVDSNSDRITVIEATTKANRWWILTAFSAATVIAAALAIFF